MRRRWPRGGDLPIRPPVAERFEVTNIVQQCSGYQVIGCPGAFGERRRLQHVGGEADLFTQVALHSLAGEELCEAIDRRWHPSSLRHSHC